MNRPVVYSAIPTAFTDGGELDLASTERIFAHALSGGVDALFVNGTTAEFPALSLTERRRTLESAVEVAGADRVIAHVGAASPYQTGQLTEDALALGVTKLSVLTPFYMPSTLDGVRDQITAATSLASSRDVYLYLFPDRTGVQIGPEEAAALIEEFDLAGAKISIAGVDYLARVVARVSSPRSVLSGNDGLLREVVAAGGGGVVSGVSSSVPRPFVALADAIGTGDVPAQDAASRDVATVVPVLGPSIAGLKHSLVLQKVIQSDFCRMAIDSPDPESRARIVQALATASVTAAPAA